MILAQNKILLFSFISLLFFYSCGKSPLQKKIKRVKIVSGHDIEFYKRKNQNKENNTNIIFENYQTKFQWLTPLTLGEESKFNIKFYDLERQDSQYNGTILAFLWMPSMGHGSYPIKIEKLTPSEFLLSEIFFTMEGEWDLHLQFQLQLQNSQVEKIVKIKI